MRKLRVGVIGAGMMGQNHIEAIRRIPGTEVVALADANLQFAKSIADKLGIENVYGDYSVMLEEANLDVVHNCTPNSLHYAINKDIIKHNINVYCEKPLANTAEETSELARLAEQHKVFTAVNFNYRHNAIVREMHERVADKAEWGNTYLVHGQYVQDWMMYDSDYNWRCVPAIGGPSRTVADIGSHWFDTVQYILGEKIVRVNAELTTVLPQRKKFAAQGATFTSQSGDDFEWVDIDTEDTAFITVEFESGVKGNVVLSQVSGGHKNDFCIHIDGSSYSMNWEQENADKLVIGSREIGNILRHAGPEMLRGSAKGYGTLPSGHPVGWADALKNAISAFYTAVSGGEAPAYATFADGDYTVRIVEACLRSSKTKTWTEVK